jgi:hypothetical protein
MKLAARIAGVGLVGPGLAGWNSSLAILAGRAPYEPRATVLPSPDALPPTERRRAGKSVRLALGAGLEAVAASGIPARDLVATFASSSGDGENLHAICEVLASDDRMISPTRFHNSVHNAPSGYWGIATGAMQAADSLAAYDGSFGAGLLEALCRVARDPARPVLLVSYDAPYPEPLNACRPLPDSFACALVIAADRPGASGTPIAVALGDAPPTQLGDGASFEPLRRGIPAARSLPLLIQLARASPGRVVIEYLGRLSIAVEVGA